MIKINKTDFTPFWGSHTPVKVTSMGNVTEILMLQKKSDGCVTKKIDKDHYFDTRTGEIFEYNHISSRAESTQSIRHTLSHIRALINTNVTIPQNVRWLTFTYAENMKDTQRLYRDYSAFWRRFKRFCLKQKYSIPEYITVQEPQGRGAWHIHAFFIWSETAPFIPNDEIARLWRQGFTKIKALKETDNIGAYFSAYLADVPIAEFIGDNLSSAIVQEKTFTDDDGNSKTKKFVKGGRLCLYPPGMNIVRRTKGIKLPDVEYLPYFCAEKKVSGATETFSSKYEILDESGNVLNQLSKVYYNNKR